MGGVLSQFWFWSLLSRRCLNALWNMHAWACVIMPTVTMLMTEPCMHQNKPPQILYQLCVFFILRINLRPVVNIGFPLHKLWRKNFRNLNGVQRRAYLSLHLRSNTMQKQDSCPHDWQFVAVEGLHLHVFHTHSGFSKVKHLGPYLHNQRKQPADKGRIGRVSDQYRCL